MVARLFYRDLSADQLATVVRQLIAFLLLIVCLCRIAYLA
jgi:hypothetical protein